VLKFVEYKNLGWKYYCKKK